jgi:hypothetical protein
LALPFLLGRRIQVCSDILVEILKVPKSAISKPFIEIAAEIW